MIYSPCRDILGKADDIHDCVVMIYHLLSQWIKKFDKSKLVEFFGRGWRTVTRGADCAPWSFAALTVHRTVIHFRSYFKSLFPQKNKAKA